MSLDLSQFQQTFFEEAAENLASMEALLVGIDIAVPADDDLNAIFRAAHSIKGGAAMFGLTDISGFTHVLETLLDRIRKHEIALNTLHVDAFLEAGDLIRAMIARHQGGGDADTAAVASCQDRLAEMAGGTTEAAASPPELPEPPAPVSVASATSSGWRLELGPMSRALFDSVRSELASRGRLTVQAEPDLEAASGTWVLELRVDAPDEAAERLDAECLTAELQFILPPEAIRIEPIAVAAADDDGFGFFDDEPATAAAVPAPADDGSFGFFDDEPAGVVAAVPPPPPPPPPPRSAGTPAGAAPDASSIRVSVGKVDQLINLVGELVINQAMLSETASQVDPILYERLTNGLAQLERNTRNLQESVMSMRMMPVSSVFSRFPRVVRDISQRLGKDIELRFVGENTEIDRGVIEKIADPLTHLVRNSLDHGIETPDVRLAVGKPARGTLTLRASHQGANIVIEVIDDGGGLPRDKILAKAHERGFNVSDSMPDADVWQLIFEPGFSTAEQVTDVSGRGVGMDVVRRNIAELGGRIEIQSTLGKGTSIIIRLPLTLAILDGLSVAVGDETYIIPLAYIVESLQPQAAAISTVGRDHHVVEVRSEYLPVLPLHSVLGGGPRANRFEEGIFVILESDTDKIALFVDELVGESQVVIKSLESNYAKVSGISGATILGDGRVALILDVAALVRRCSHANRSAA